MMLPQSFYADDGIRKGPGAPLLNRNAIDDKNKVTKLKTERVTSGSDTVNIMSADV